jgi:hypothetical protein
MSRRNQWYSVSGNPGCGMAGLADVWSDMGLDPTAIDAAAGLAQPGATAIPPTSVSVYADTPWVIAQSNPVINPAQSQSSWLDSALKSAESVAKSFMTYKQASDFNAINLQRAKQGLPPLNPQQYAPQVNFGLSTDIQNMLMIGGGALLLILFLSSRKH